MYLEKQLGGLDKNCTTPNEGASRSDHPTIPGQYPRSPHCGDDLAVGSQCGARATAAVGQQLQAGDSREDWLLSPRRNGHVALQLPAVRPMARCGTIRGWPA